MIGKRRDPVATAAMGLAALIGFAEAAPLSIPAEIPHRGVVFSNAVYPVRLGPMTGIAWPAVSVPPTVEAVARVERAPREIGEKIMASHADIMPRDEATASVTRILAPQAIAVKSIKRIVKKELKPDAQEIYAH